MISTTSNDIQKVAMAPGCLAVESLALFCLYWCWLVAVSTTSKRRNVSVMVVVVCCQLTLYLMCVSVVSVCVSVSVFCFSGLFVCVYIMSALLILWYRMLHIKYSFRFC